MFHLREIKLPAFGNKGLNKVANRALEVLLQELLRAQLSCRKMKDSQG